MNCETTDEPRISMTYRSVEVNDFCRQWDEGLGKGFDFIRL
jgi:hypothetical protein